MQNKIVMHKHSLDVCLVIRDSYLDRHGVVASGYWYNLGYTGKPWYLDMSEPVTLDDDWIDITDKFNKVRTKPGLPE